MFGLFRCVDYLQIRTAAGIVLTENCGNDIGELNGYTVTESKIASEGGQLTTNYCHVASYIILVNLNLDCLHLQFS